MDEAISVKRQGRLDLIFDSKREVESFVHNEDKVWEWCENATPSINELNQFIGRYKKSSRDSIRQILLTNADDWPAQASRFFGKRYSDGKTLIAGDREACSVCILSQEDLQLAATVLALMSGGLGQNLLQSPFLESPANFRAFGHASAIFAGIDSTAPGAAAAALRSTRSELDQTHSELRSAIASVRQEASDEKGRIASEAVKEAEQRATDSTSTEQRRQKEYETLRVKLEKTDEFYTKQMEVKGAVRYWGARAKQHRTSASLALVCLLIFTAGSTCSLYWLYSEAAGRLPATVSPTDPFPLAAVFKAAAFGLLMTTIIFWIGRVILRLYLSERHLATDAEERRTMVMTYLALTRTKTVSDEDKKLIFPSIFRSGADGIVKDDNSPDTAFAALVASIMKR